MIFRAHKSHSGGQVVGSDVVVCAHEAQAVFQPVAVFEVGLLAQVDLVFRFFVTLKFITPKLNELVAVVARVLVL